MGSKLPRRALAAVLLLTVWQTNHLSSAWSAQFFKQSPHRRVTRFSNIPDLGGFSQVIDTLKPNDIWNQFQGLDSVVNLLQKIQKLWSEFESPKVYTSGSNRTDHVSFLMKRMEKALQGGNVIVPGEFVELLPLEPVRNTSVERLMIEVLCGRTQWGMRSIFAEPGSGKSVASILAAYEVATRLTSSDVFVVLQNDMEERLKEFYLIEQMSSAADIATLFFSSLKNNGTRLTMILDNAMDGGVRDDVQKDRLKALARAATKYGHMILFTTQDKEAAQSIGKLNGVTTNIAKNQNFTAGAYRWNEEETLQLTKTFLPNKKPEELKEVVFGAEIPDSIGGWRPRDTEVFINTGEPPRLLQQQAGGIETQTKPVWVRQLRKDGAGGLELTGNAFQVKDKELQNIDDLKKAIKKEKQNKVQCDADEIDIYLQEDGNWTRQTRMSESLRDTDEDSPYGYFLP